MPYSSWWASRHPIAGAIGTVSLGRAVVTALLVRGVVVAIRLL
ncbi:hypothetical protein [Streptomyces adustus]|nr:hypothetical protein [Streptomyces adustus]